MNTFFAQPYNLDAVGFYFENIESYAEQSQKLLDAFGTPVEEFEIQFIDGDDCQLFSACGVNQANLELWFETIVDLPDHEKTALFYLCSNLGYRLENALVKLDEVILSQDNLQGTSELLFDECYLIDIPESVRSYINYEKFAHDCELSGEMTQFDFNGTTWTCTNASSL